MGEIKTYTGKLFDPLSPKADLIDIRDIAHALSLLCRANGHCKTFYSVGQHSINCMIEAAARGCTQRVQLGCLLHDASEAYLSDLTRPVKAVFPAYLEIEAPLQHAIFNKWLETPLTAQETAQIFEIDDAMLHHEFVVLMDTRLSDIEPPLVSAPVFTCSDFSRTEQEFLQRFQTLTGGSNEFFTVGVDWMNPRWIAVEMRGLDTEVRCFDRIDQLCNAYQGADAILIDLPLGLPESKEEAALRPDGLARNYLQGKRKSSVFNVLFRQIVYADTVEESWELNRQLDAKMTVTGQALRPMLRQVDSYLQQHPQWKNRLTESHPEVVFQVLNHGNGLAYSKHTSEGIAERRRILERYGLNVQPLLNRYSQNQREDVLDAASLALSAQLGCRNGFQTIPETPACDRLGLKMQIAFGKT